jgi:hypothetical protein
MQSVLDAKVQEKYWLTCHMIISETQIQCQILCHLTLADVFIKGVWCYMSYGFVEGRILARQPKYTNLMITELMSGQKLPKWCADNSHRQLLWLAEGLMGNRLMKSEQEPKDVETWLGEVSKRKTSNRSETRFRSSHYFKFLYTPHHLCSSPDCLCYTHSQSSCAQWSLFK